MLRSSAIAAIVLGAIYLFYGSPVVAASTPSARATTPGVCVLKRSDAVDLDAIINEVFVAKPAELLAQHIITQNYYNAVRLLQYELCDDRTWDVVTQGGTYPLVIFDTNFMSLLGAQSTALVLGQYLSNERANLSTLGLHGALMRHVLNQNLDHLAPALSLPDIVDKWVGMPVDLHKYFNDPKFMQRVENTILVTDYFVIFHEFCHVHLGHLQSRARIGSSTAKELTSATQKTAALVQLEIDADSCAMDIMNRDEAQYKSAPASFFSVFMVVATQSVLERIPALQGAAVTHPSSRARLGNAYQLSLKAISGTPDEGRYSAAIKALFRHFSELTLN